MSLDYHPTEPNLLATGGRDGKVHVWTVRADVRSEASMNKV